VVEYQIPEKLLDLAFLALDHGFNSIKDGKSGILIPFVMFEHGDERSLNRYVADTAQESVERAFAAIPSLPLDTTRYAVAFEGYITLEGRRWDAVIVEAGETGFSQGETFALRYQKKKGLFARGYESVGNPIHLGPAEQRFNNGEG
jgi:hypothetical protein